MKPKTIVLLALAHVLFLACKKEINTLSTVNTLVLADIKSTSAEAGAYVYLDGGEEISQKGMVWSTNPGPILGNSNTNEGPGAGYFSSKLTGLTPYTTYYLRAYAINSVGISYSEEKTFKTANPNLNPNLNYNSVTDASGNSYATITIGTQEWMAENLRTTKYANGDPITIPTGNQFYGPSIGLWAYYDFNSQFDFPYGKLYNWYAVNDPRNVCPAGWHVPSQQEWNNLINYLGGPSVAGGKLKSYNRDYWKSPNTDGTNESGFSALPGGYITSTNSYTQGETGFWWSSSNGGTYGPYYIYMTHDGGFANFGDMTASNGICIRCLKN